MFSLRPDCQSTVINHQVSDPLGQVVVEAVKSPPPIQRFPLLLTINHLSVEVFGVAIIAHPLPDDVLDNALLSFKSTKLIV